MREGMWSVVAERKHTVTKVFPGRFNDNEDSKEAELMLHGVSLTLLTFGTYKTKDGNSSTVPWAGHAILKKVQVEGGEEAWKLAEYRVYLLK